MQSRRRERGVSVTEQRGDMFRASPIRYRRLDASLHVSVLNNPESMTRILLPRPRSYKRRVVYSPLPDGFEQQPRRKGERSMEMATNSLLKEHSRVYKKARRLPFFCSDCIAPMRPNRQEVELNVYKKTNRAVEYNWRRLASIFPLFLSSPSFLPRDNAYRHLPPSIVY